MISGPIDWIKTNLIAVLGIGALVLGLGWALDHYIGAAKYSRLETKHTRLEGAFKDVVTVNEQEVKKLKDLQAAFNALVERNAYNAKAAEEAGARVEMLKRSYDAQLKANAALRDQLALENPDVRTYMDSGMPCDLARSLWPGADYCKEDRVR